MLVTLEAEILHCRCITKQKWVFWIAYANGPDNVDFLDALQILLLPVPPWVFGGEEKKRCEGWKWHITINIFTSALLSMNYNMWFLLFLLSLVFSPCPTKQWIFFRYKSALGYLQEKEKEGNYATPSCFSFKEIVF